mgnify:CR=1 FL=1|tara:strand:- start:1568 stop:2932 length:1365 start_codon:yes stop_codon:yes gene_type:complete
MATIGIIINWIIWAPWVFKGLHNLFLKKGLNSFLLLSAFIMPFYSASFGIMSFQFSIYKILPLFLFLIFLTSHTRINNFLLLFISYMVFITIVSYIYNYYDGRFDFAMELGRNKISAYYGPIIQAILFIMTFFQLVRLPKKSQISHVKIMSFYIYGCILLVIVGYVQMVFYKTGVPWFDFWFLSDAVGRGIDGGLNSHAMDRGFHRMSSLGGEPRHFSATLVLAILLQNYLVFRKINVRLISDRYRNLFSLFIVSGIAMSFSASSVLALFIALIIFYSLSDFKMVLIFTLIIFGTIFFFSSTHYLTTLLWKLSSYDMLIYAAKKDGFAIQAIFHNWYYFLFGYGLNLADIVVPDYYLLQETPFGFVNRYLEEKPMDGAIAPTSAILQIMLSGGLVSIFLCILFIKNSFKELSKASKLFLASFIGCICVSSFLIFVMGLFFIGIIINFEKEQKNL